MLTHTRSFYVDLLARRLTPSRLRHSLAVEKRAVALAACHGADWYRAGLAGLVHDICRCDDPDWMRDYLTKNGRRPDREWLQNPQLWHAPCGSLYLRRELGLRDPQILSAVTYHTTGRPGMTLLEKVVFLADSTGEDRDFEGVDRLRELSMRSLDEAVYFCLGDSVARVAKNGWPLVKETYEAYNEYAHYYCDKTRQEDIDR